MATVPEFNHEDLGIDLKRIWEDPENFVVREPIKGAIYWFGISVLGLFVALVFPFLGYGAIGGIFTLIGRAVILNRREVIDNMIERIDAECVQRMLRGVFGDRRREARPPPRG